jgi:hypothetical protein
VQKHQVETKGKAGLVSCPLIFQEGEDGIPHESTPPPTPPSAGAFSVLRTSSRIGHDAKRSYEGMQSRSSAVGRPYKKLKYTCREMPGMLPATNESYPNPLNAALRKESTAETAEPRIRDTTAAPTVTSTTSQNTVDMMATSASDHTSTVITTDGNSVSGEPSGTDCVETPTVKCLVLDESSSTLEAVLDALRTQKTDRATDSMVPSVTCYLILSRNEQGGRAVYITQLAVCNCGSNFATVISPE